MAFATIDLVVRVECFGLGEMAQGVGEIGYGGVGNVKAEVHISIAGETGIATRLARH